jgi:large subunit ribosomal protein L25
MAVMKARHREQFGSRKMRKLRAGGEVPAIIYGHGDEPEPITVSEHDVALAILHGERLLELKLGRKSQHALIKEIQWDTFGQEVLHMDLARVRLDERVEVAVPVTLHGTPVGVSEDGGTLQQYAAEVNIECLVTAIPDDVSVTVNDMGVGDTLHAGDLDLPEGAKLLDDAETAICSVTYIAEEEPAAEEVEGAEAAAEPEVIGEQAEEPAGEGEGTADETSGESG